MMNEERMKILQMLADHVITAEQANQLLEALHSTDAVEGEFEKSDEDREREKQAKKTGGFDQNLKDGLKKIKEDLAKAKVKISEEIHNIDVQEIEENLKKGMDEIDQAMKEADRVLTDFGHKIIDKFTSKKEE